MEYLGDIPAGNVLDFKFSTNDGTGAPATLSGSPAISVYKDNSTTESTSGVALTVDFDARTGCNHCRIDTSSDGTFYAAGHEYQAVITTGTSGSVSVVGVPVAHFSIENRTQKSDVRKWNGTSVASPATAGIPEVNVKNVNNVATSSVTAVNANLGTTQPTNFTGTGGSALVKTDTIDIGGTAQTAADLAAILGALNTAAATGDPGTTTTLVAYLKQLINILIGSAGVATFPASAVPGDAVSLAEIIRKIYDLRAADTAQSGDAFARLGAPAGVSVSADIAAVGTSAASAASNAGSAASAASSAASSAGTAVTQTTGSAIAAAVLDVATSGHQTAGTVGKAISDAGAAGTPPTAAAIAAAVRDVDNTSPAAGSLGAKVNTAAGAGAAPSAAAIADAVWDENRTGHTTANTFGKFLDAQVSTISGGSGGGTDWTAEERAQILAWLEATYDKTQLIGSGTLESTSPVMQDGSLRLVRGDDYTDVPLSWTITDYAGPDLTDGSVSFALFPKNGTAAELSVSDGTVTINSTTVTLTVSLTREQTLQLSAPPSTAPNYRFQVRATTADGKKHTNVYGVATVLPELVS
jgi:ubiquinone biosynthesis protein UbiJ